MTRPTSPTRPARRPRRSAATALLAAATLLGGVPLALAQQPTTAAAATSQVHRQVTIGWSVQHRPIRAYLVGDLSASKTVLVLGQMHGNEKAGVSTAMAMVRDTRPVKGIRLWVVPTLNPDGYAHNTRYNAHGVDLNRNWSYSWVRTAVSGRAAMSEPENVALRRFLLAQHPSLVVSLHQPLDGVDAFGAKNLALRNALARNLGLPVRSFTCQGGCHGTMTQWINRTTTMAGNTVEYVQRPSTWFVTVRARDGIVAALGGRH